MRFMRTLLALAAALALLESRVSAQSDGASAVTTPSPTAVLPLKLGPNKNVIYVFAVGSTVTQDPLLHQKFVTGLTDEIQIVQAYYDNAATQFIPEPDWSISDFISACKANRDLADGYSLVSGALIIGIQQWSAYTSRNAIQTFKKTTIDANLSYASCTEGPKPKKTPPPNPSPAPKSLTTAKTRSSKTGATRGRAARPVVGAKPPSQVPQFADCSAALSPQPSPTPGPSNSPTPSPNSSPTPALTTCQYTQVIGSKNKLVSTWSVPTPAPSPSSAKAYITWQSFNADGWGQHSFFTPFAFLSGLLMVTSTYMLLAPTHTSMSSQTTTFPTPEPWNPPPPNGYVSSQTQSYSTGSNAGTLGTFATAFLGQEAGADQAIAQQQTADQQTMSAIKLIVEKLVFYPDFMHCPIEAERNIGRLPYHAPSFVPLGVDTMCYKILEAEEPAGNPIPHNPSSSP